MANKEIQTLDSLEILKKIQEFDTTKEVNKFLLFMFVAGYIAIISSLIEYFFYSYEAIDLTFYIFQDLPSNSNLSVTNQPLLFIIIWSIHLLPFMAIFLFTTENSGLIDFSIAYKKIGFLILILFIGAEFGVFFLGKNNYSLIQVIWGFGVTIGLIMTGIIFYKDFKFKTVLVIMIILSLLTVIEITIVYTFFDNLGPTIITFSIGMQLMGSATTVFLLKKFNWLKISLKSIEVQKTLEKDSQESLVIKNLEIINNYLQNTIGISHDELFDYIRESKAIIKKNS